MRILLIRHGLTGLGEEGRYQGRLDEGLSGRGRGELKPARLAPERVYVSPMRRARETAAILFPDAVQIPVENLREMDFGAFEGRSWREMENDPDYRAWVDGGCLGRCPGGEDRAGFSARVCDAFEAVLGAERGSEALVIVAHGGTQMAVLERWGAPEHEYYDWQRPCGCGWLLEREADGRLRVLEEVDYRT